MNLVQAVRLQRRSHCLECPHKTPVIRMDMAHSRQYIVVCPTSDDHTLSHGKSQFTLLLDRWREGYMPFSLDGLMFTHGLRVRQQKDPVGWDYEEDHRGVIRIGKELWPGLPKEEMETMSQSVTVRDFSSDQIELLKTQIAPGVSDAQLGLFLVVARRTGLDPFRKQIYCILYNKNTKQKDGSWTQEKVMSIQTGIDGYRAIAARSKSYAGSDDPVFGPSTPEGYPSWAKVTVYKVVQGVRIPFSATCRWEEFAYDVKRRDGKVVKELRDAYIERPFNQLAVRAESHALRKGFPEEMEDIELADTPQGRVYVETGELVQDELPMLPDGTIEIVPDEAAVVTEETPPAEPAPTIASLDSQAADCLAALEAATSVPELDETAAMIKDLELSGKEKTMLRAAYLSNRVRIEKAQGALL